MSFSIVMLTWNNVEKLKVAMESMFFYLYSPEVLEIIIIDNGSEEQELLNYLRQISAAFSKVEVIFWKENRGISVGRKKLYELARGDYILSFDSDIKLIDPNYLLQVLKRNLGPLPWEGGQGPTLFLIGGGGGNHPFYPALYMSDVKNEINRQQKNEFIIVDEVAGWCQCFRRSLLEKVEMDTRFSPFWGEDSDFCIQIKELGGKCAILGRGVIDHKFSSCRNNEKRKPLKKMWEKVIEKWYPKMDMDFPIDKTFYSIRYKTETPLQDYFSSTDGGTPGIFNGKQYCEEKERDHYTFKYSSFGKMNGGDIYIVNGNADYPEGEKALIINGEMKDNSIVINSDYISKYHQNVLIQVFHFIEEYNFEKIRMIGFEDNTSSLDTKYNRRGLQNLIRIGDEDIKNNYQEYSFEVVKEIYSSYPIQKMLNCLKNLPGDYENKICPSYSPVHITPELFERIYNNHDTSEKKILSIVIGENIQEIKITIGDIFYIDVDSVLNKIPSGVDYFYRIEDLNLRRLFRFLDSSSSYFIYEYDIICIYDLREIEIKNWKWTNEFIERSIYQNQIYIQNDTSIFSFEITDLDNFIKLENFLVENTTKVNKNVNLDKSFVANLLTKFHFSPIWKRKIARFENVEQISYSRDDEDPDNLIDFPFLKK